MTNVELRILESFPEPETSALQREVFADYEQSQLLAEVLASEAASRRESSASSPSMFRVGAFRGSDLEGWTLVLGRFHSPPGVRLYGTAGPLRRATEAELQRIEARVRSAKRLKCGRLLWASFTHVRELTFSSFRPVSYPVMMESLWRADA